MEYVTATAYLATLGMVKSVKQVSSKYSSHFKAFVTGIAKFKTLETI